MDAKKEKIDDKKPEEKVHRKTAGKENLQKNLY